MEDNQAERATALSNLSLAYYRVGNLDKARTAIDESISIFRDLDAGMNPHYAGALNTQATFAYLAGNYTEAAENFKQAVEKTKLIFGENKDYVPCCRNCSMALEQAGDKAGAAEYAAMADHAAQA